MSNLTDEELKDIARIPDNVELKDVLQRLLFNLCLKGTLRPRISTSSTIVS
jgi:hypothetical protein